MHSACSPEGPLCFTCKPSPHTQHTGKFQSHCKTRSTAESTLHRNPITLSLCRLKRESSHHWLSLISTCQHRGWAAQGGPASPETCLHPSEMCGAAPQGMGRGGGGGWEAAVLNSGSGSVVIGWVIETCSHSVAGPFELLLLDMVCFLVFLRGNPRPGIGLCLNRKHARRLWEGQSWASARVFARWCSDIWCLG